jgi:phosphoglycolate phosphatase-like HAD superfamily hydrolase
LDTFDQVFGPHRHAFDHARFHQSVSGFSTTSISERILTDEPPKYQVPSWKKEDAFRKLVSGQIQSMPELITLLTLADRASIPMAAVTNAPSRNAEILLSGRGMAHRFKFMVIGD